MTPGIPRAEQTQTASPWILNNQDYLQAPGLSALVFNNNYPSGKQGGVEIIQHGERVASCGDLRLEATPGQWAVFPRIVARQTEAHRRQIEVRLSYPEQQINYTVRVEPCGESLAVSVDLDQPLAPEWAGQVSFNLELFPPAYFGKTFHLGNAFGIFPRQANGPMIPDAPDRLQSVPLAHGAKLVMAAEEPLRRLTIERIGGEIQLLDGRSAAQNGWFIARSLVPPGLTHSAIQWLITPHAIAGWQRDPVISISQVGYHPDQVKRAIIELDPRAASLHPGRLFRVDPDAGPTEVFSAQPQKWDNDLHYAYAVFDFTRIREPGMYLVNYGSQSTPPFRISSDVYRNGVWEPALETFIPVQMCHLEVRDRYRVWHGACHLDDALQAPVSHAHFDGYGQGPTTDTPYAALQHIPGLNAGGWHDAGDYDLAASSQAHTVFILTLAREAFGVDSDQTTVNQAERCVLLHTPDGIPDILQQIEHGVENLLTGYRLARHSFAGIIENSLEQYVHLGDPLTMTDNRVYDPALAPGQVSGDRSGRADDRWVFTSWDTCREYQVITALAAASRVLRGYTDSLAEECLHTALNAWDYEQTHPPVHQPSGYTPEPADRHEIFATLELLITLPEARFRERLIALLPAIITHIAKVGWAVTRAFPQVRDETFIQKVGEAIRAYHLALSDDLARSPYGVPARSGIWGMGWDHQQYAVEQYYLIKAYPQLFNRENLLRVVNYILGCHPGSDVSFVSGVGARSLTVAYGYNRDDGSYIPGGVASGTALIRPDFPELKDNFPYLWQQAEYVIFGAATYIFCILAADELLNGPS